MPVQRPPRLAKLRRYQKHRHLPIDPSRKKQATKLSVRSSDDSAHTNFMELDEPENGPEETELEEDIVHESRAEPEWRMGDSELRRIDRHCFDTLSAWLSEVSLT